MRNTLPHRSEVDPQYTWNAESVFPSARAWETEISSILEGLPRLKAWKGSLWQDPRILAEALEARDALLARAERALVYAAFSASVDTTDQDAAAKAGKARSVGAEVRAAASFIDPEILAIGRERLEEWMAQEPRLTVYRHAFDDLVRKQAHVRSAEVEEVLGMVSDPFSGPGTTASFLTNADFRFLPGTDSGGASVEVAQGTLPRVLASADREARRTAWRSYTDAYLAHKNTLASNLSTSLKQFLFCSRVRGHDSCLAASLFHNNIPVAVYHNLLEVFRENLPIWHRYFALRRETLGLKKIAHYDMWAPLSPGTVAVTFEQAVGLICAGLAPLGEDYVAIVRKGCLEERWVDVYPNQGKRAGAFSWGTPGTHPFIMTSFNDTVLSLSTLAHELGHSMHSYLAWKHQPFVYCDYSLFIAEVASNLHQALVRAHLLQAQTERRFRIAVLEEAMANYLRYMFLMPTLARFELETHAWVESGKTLTAATLIDLMIALLSEGYGEGVELDPSSVGMLWATFSHLYSDFYVYQYSTGIAGAQAIARLILDGESQAAENYLAFLKAGASLYPLEALQLAGVDLSRTEPIQEAFDAMRDIIEQLEVLL